MPHYPKPFYRKPRRRWYVEIDGKQINLGPDRGEAFRQYHELMASPEPVAYRPTDPGQPVAMLCDRFLEWIQSHRAEPTYEGYRYRLQRFIDRHPDLTVAELRPFHVRAHGLTASASRFAQYAICVYTYALCVMSSIRCFQRLASGCWPH